MSISTILFAVSCLMAVLSCVFIYQIAFYLSERGQTIEFLYIRWKVNKYLNDYKELSLRQSGKIGLSYYLVYLTFIPALLCLIGSLVFKILTIK